MDKEELAIRISDKTEVSIDVCLTVLTALEEVLSEEFSDSGSMSGVFNKAFKIMEFFKKKKEK